MRRLLCLCAALLAAGAFASLAGASPPQVLTVPYTVTEPASGVCSFPVSVTASGTAIETFFFDSDGSFRVGVHQTEADSFTANGITLTGEQYVSNYQVRFDAQGNITSYFAQGVVERIVLPDGTLFLTAGRSNILVWPPGNPGGFALTPQFGSQSDSAAFCAALS